MVSFSLFMPLRETSRRLEVEKNLDTKLSVPKKTAGAIALENYNKIPDTLNAHELMQEQLTEWDENVQCCYNRGKKIYHDSDFYIVVLVKHEKLLGHKVLHPLFMPRKSCPTPQWDQTVYQCKRESGDIVLLWTLPSKEVCQYYIDTATTTEPEEWDLLRFILMDKNGELLTLAKKLNKEII